MYGKRADELQLPRRVFWSLESLVGPLGPTRLRGFFVHDDESARSGLWISPNTSLTR